MTHILNNILLVNRDVDASKHLTATLDIVLNSNINTLTDPNDIMLFLHKNGIQYSIIIIDETASSLSKADQKQLITLTQDILYRFPDIEIILLVNNQRMTLRALEAGAFRCLVGPINQKDLTAQILLAMKHFQMRRAARQKLLSEQNAALERSKRQLLEKLSIASSEIIGHLGEISLDERLQRIVQHATDILESEACGIFLVRKLGFLSLEASFGHHENGFQKKSLFAIRCAPHSGLTGCIAAKEEIFRMHGEALNAHPAVSGKPTHTQSGHCYSLLGVYSGYGHFFIIAT